MKEIFKDILLENQFIETEEVFNRNLKCTFIPKKAMVLIGVRRSGKTTFLRQIAVSLCNNSTLSEGQIVYINFSDERLLPLSADKLNLILVAHSELYPDLNDKQIIHFFFDEIQNVEKWEYFVDRLLRSSKHRIYIIGSSAKLLSKEIATAMRGRTISYELFPFSFKEILEWEKIPYKNPPTNVRAKILNRFKKYMLEGGFPEVIHQPPNIQRKILQEYYQVLIYKDIIDRYKVDHTVALGYTLKLLINQIANSYTINKITHKIKSMGISIDKEKISNYLSWSQDCYIFFSVPIFTESVSRQMANPRKLYCIDNGLVNAINSRFSDEIGNKLENLIFIELRRQYEQIFYFKDHQGSEVDFVVISGKTIKLIQVTDNLKSSTTYEREVGSLKNAMSFLKLKKGTIITMEDNREIEVDEGIIKIIPAWKFMTSQESL
ncbi:MAG: ATP-binding protein [Oligoflexia bacterium]|nr:ATP-binding protein [Oligoflexia bacterium]